MRTLVICCLSVILPWVSALETPLTLAQPGSGNNRVVTIDPSSGAMRLYEIRGGQGTQAMRQISPWNFLIDLDRIRNIRMVVPNPNRVDRHNDPEFVFWPLARTGSAEAPRGGRASNSPMYGEMYEYFLPNQRVTVLNSEDQFFNQLPAYDGVVRAALSTGYLIVVIPSSYTMLAYRIADDSFDLVAYRNYRPELYMVITDQSPRGLPNLGSAPRFNDMKLALQRIRGGDLLLNERALRMERELEALESETEIIPVAKSEPWITAVSQDRFVMLDPPNNKIMTFEFPQNDVMRLRSVRNFDLDRRIPSWPLPQKDLQEFDRAVVESYLARLSRMRQQGQIEAITAEVMTWYTEASRNKELEFVTVTPADVQVGIFRKLAEQQDLLVGAGQSRGQRGSEAPFDAVVDSGERLILDLKKERRLLVYALRGAGDGIELRSSRDYTIETGIAVYDYEISKRQAAARIFAQIESLVNRPGAAIEGLVLSNIQYLLSISPESHVHLEGNRRVVRRFSSHELWQPTIETAMAETEAKQERILNLIELVKADFVARDAAIRAAHERAAEGGRRAR